ncbi:hypothetical protein EDB89DRAFT_1910496 [Lactarius sanguifluus]|nr:hypothetical protein EDB89DRAFT_1910496 [Lactarius sanguifluus]
MPALIPLHNTLGALFIGTVLSSLIYGVTWLQVYSYYNSHCSRDRWPLKSFSLAFKTWSQPLFLKYLYSSTTRIGFIVSSARVFSTPASSNRIGVVSNCRPYQELSIAAISCAVLCDVLIAVGMVYALLSNRTQVRRTNNVLNLLAISSISCGTLHLLNSRDNLRETLDGPEGGVITFTQLNVRSATTVPYGAQGATEASTDTAVPKSLPPASVSSDKSFDVIAFNREKYLGPPAAVLAV